MMYPVGQPYQVSMKHHGLDADWMRDGACADIGVRAYIFFADEKRSRQGKLDAVEAKMMCSGCPVRDPCLEYALTAKMHWIWGGTDEKERRAIARLRRQRQVA